MLLAVARARESIDVYRCLRQRRVLLATNLRVAEHKAVLDIARERRPERAVGNEIETAGVLHLPLEDTTSDNVHDHDNQQDNAHDRASRQAALLLVWRAT